MPATRAALRSSARGPSRRDLIPGADVECTDGMLRSFSYC